MISNYDIAKEILDIVDVAEKLGVSVIRRKEALCPFHNDVKTPNLHFWPNNTFKCFSCGEQGDVISFVSRKEKLLPNEALAWLNSAYNLGLKLDEDLDPQIVQQIHMEREHKREIKKLINLAAKQYGNYFRMLMDWREKYAPKSMNEELDERFIASLTQLDYIEYICDSVFIQGDYEEKRRFVLRHKKQLVKIIQILKDGDKTDQKEKIVA